MALPPARSDPSCRICRDQLSERALSRKAGFCDRCLVKIGILILAILVVISYTVWFGIF